MALGLSGRPFGGAPPVAAVSPQVPPAPASVQITGHPVSGNASVLAGDESAPLVEGANLAAGSRVIVPPRSRALLAFSTGTSVLLDPNSDLRVESTGATESMRLESGAVDLRVAKLHDGQRFLVHTPDAEVEVRGTQFRVAVNGADPACGEGPWTRVSVSEGVVVVRHEGAEARVAAGETWADCTRGAEHGATASHHEASTAPAPGSNLAVQNDLFASAVSAKRQGNYRQALSGFDHLLSQYPGSPLAESATVERMRVLRSLDPPRGTSAAKDYLARYPHGFARAEAQGIAEGAP
jgi:hypothetical protein